MTNSEKYKKKLQSLEATRTRLMKEGKYVQSFQLSSDIQKIERLIQEAEEYERKPISELLSREEVNTIIPLIIESHLAVDFLVDIAFGLKERLSKLKLYDCTLFPELEQLIKIGENFTKKLASCNSSLEKLLVSNEAMIAAMHKKCLNYIHNFHKYSKGEE